MVTTIADRVRELQDLNDAVHSEAISMTQSWTAHRLLGDVVVQIVRSDPSFESHRLFPLVMATASGASIETAVQIAAVSRLWWSGAETLDDVMDGEFDPKSRGLSMGEAVMASIACLTLIPTLEFAASTTQPSRSVAWMREYAEASVHCANGQLGDVATDTPRYSWRRVMQAYVGKSGAPYGRDMALAGISLGFDEDRITAWRRCGQLFGVLRQMVNDEGGEQRPDNADLINGTPTLRFAHLLDVTDAAARATVLEIHDGARRSQAARTELRRLWNRPDVVQSYNRRVSQLYGQLVQLVKELLADSPDRDVALWMIASTASEARTGLAAVNDEVADVNDH